MNYNELRSVCTIHQQAVESAKSVDVSDNPAVQNWSVAKRITWMVLLAGSFLFFYLISKLHEALAIL
jgi:hypothetical protein